MNSKTAVPLSIGIVIVAFTAFALAKKKPYVSTAIFGTLGAFGLVYSLLRNEEIDEIRARLEVS